MDRADGLQVVLGAGGGTGRAIVDELVGQGRHVRGVTRRADTQLPSGVEVFNADLADPAAAARALDGASVVYHAAQPPYHHWQGNFEQLNDVVARAAAAMEARLVFADNLYMYGPGSSPMTELTPQRATDAKGRLRIALAADLLERHRRGELEVVIGRSADYFGPGGENTGLGKRVFGAALAGKSASWAGRLDVPHSSSYLPDMARAMVVLGDRDDAAGRAWHLPVMDPLTGSQFLEQVFAALETPPRIRVDGPLAVRLAGIFIPTVREFGGVLYQWSAPFVSDWSAFEAAFGPFRRTPFDVALEATLDWWRQHAPEADQGVVSAA